MTARTHKDMRKFGITMAAALTVIGTLILWRSGPAWPYFFGMAAFFLFSGLLFPRLLIPIERAWMKIARAIGMVTTPIILAVTFYLIITPIGLIMRLAGRDTLERKSDKGAKSYWVPVDPDGPTSRHDKPY